MRAFGRVLGWLFLTGAVGFMMWVTVPRVVDDLRFGDGFVPATTAQATKIRCKVWSGFLANNCTVGYRMRGDAAEHELEDFRFGGAPAGPFRLMQHRDVPSRVTTDVSLATVWNRLGFALVFAGFGVMLVVIGVGAVAKRAR